MRRLQVGVDLENTMPETIETINEVEQQRCFVGDDGWMYCNWVNQKGRIIQGKNGWLRFLPKSLKRHYKSEESDDSDSASNRKLANE